VHSDGQTLNLLSRMNLKFCYRNVLSTLILGRVKWFVDTGSRLLRCSLLAIAVWCTHHLMSYVLDWENCWYLHYEIGCYPVALRHVAMLKCAAASFVISLLCLLIAVQLATKVVLRYLKCVVESKLSVYISWGVSWNGTEGTEEKFYGAYVPTWQKGNWWRPLVAVERTTVLWFWMNVRTKL
jgi:hypothetical protein